MTGLVVDVSVMGPLIVPDERDDLVPAVLNALLAGEALVPLHWRLEVANLARMAVRKGRLTDQALVAVFDDFRDLNVSVDPETDRLAWGDSLELSRRHDLTAYDAAYLELAMRADLPLATLDRRVRDAAARTEKVELLPK